MILNDLHIIEHCKQYNMIEPFNPMLVNPASYDLTLWGELIEITPGGVMDASNSGNVAHRYTSERKIKLSYGQSYLLQPGVFILASSVERVKIPPTLAAEVKLKSTTARKGIGHVYSGWIDPGFEGQITFELFSHVPVLLEPGKPIAQIIFNEMVQPPQTSYSGRYQFQFGPTPARTFEDQYPIWDNYAKGLAPNPVGMEFEEPKIEGGLTYISATQLMDSTPALKKEFNEAFNIIPSGVDQIWSDAQGNVYVKSPDGQEHMLSIQIIVGNWNKGIHPAQTVSDFVNTIIKGGFEPNEVLKAVSIQEAEANIQAVIDAVKEDFGPGTISFSDNWSQRPRPRVDRDWGEENDL